MLNLRYMKRQLQTGYIALGLVSVLWGTTYIAARIGTQHIPGFFMAGLRQFTAGFIMVSFFLLRGYKIPGIQSLKSISIQGILLLCMANGMLTWSVGIHKRRSCSNHRCTGADIDNGIQHLVAKKRKIYLADGCWIACWICGGRGNIL